MMMYDNNLILTCCTLILSIFLFIRSIILRKKTGLQQTLLNAQTQELETINEKLQQQESIQVREKSFHADLKQAEVTTELQKSRSSLTGSNQRRQRPPERYRYALSMFQSGIKKEEIASALRMSGIELSQLLKLADISCEAEKLKTGVELAALT